MVLALAGLLKSLTGLLMMNILFCKTLDIRHLVHKYYLGIRTYGEFHQVTIYGVTCLLYTAELYQDHAGWRLTL